MSPRSRPTTYAALLRGINLGARNRVAMADLRGLVEELGGVDVRTYVQSGNVVFRSDRASAELEQAMERAVERELGHDVRVVIRTERQLRDLVANNPFLGPKMRRNSLYVTFLAEKPDQKRVWRLRERDFGPERWELMGGDVCLCLPNGYGRVKLSNAMLERQLGVAATTRNWRTVTALAELAATG
jgi:uncharacterized protein (DUF1697 family)